MERYTIRDYEEFLMAENGLHDIPSKPLQIISESQGIVDNYVKIIDELYEVASQQEPMPYDEKYSYLMYSVGDYRMVENCFIRDLTFYVFAGKKGPNYDGSQFKPKKTTHITNSYKLSDFYIFIGINDNNLISEKGKEEFYTELAHELQHAYRCYCILLSDDNDVIDWETTLKNRYTRSLAMFNPDDDVEIRKQVSRLYYLSEKDEISSERNKLFEFIRQHEEINNLNYKNYLNDMPLYDMAKEFIEFSKILKKNKKDKDFVRFVGGLFEMIRGLENKSVEESYIDFMTRLYLNGTYALRKFYITLNNAFMNFNRFHQNVIKNNTFESINNINITEEIEKIKQILRNEK